MTQAQKLISGFSISGSRCGLFFRRAFQAWLRYQLICIVTIYYSNSQMPFDLMNKCDKTKTYLAQ